MEKEPLINKKTISASRRRLNRNPQHAHHRPITRSLTTRAAAQGQQMKDMAMELYGQRESRQEYKQTMRLPQAQEEGKSGQPCELDTTSIADNPPKMAISPPSHRPSAATPLILSDRRSVSTAQSDKHHSRSESHRPSPSSKRRKLLPSPHTQGSSSSAGVDHTGRGFMSDAEPLHEGLSIPSECVGTYNTDHRAPSLAALHPHSASPVSAAANDSRSQTVRRHIPRSSSPSHGGAHPRQPSAMQPSLRPPTHHAAQYVESSPHGENQLVRTSPYILLPHADPSTLPQYEVFSMSRRHAELLRSVLHRADQPDHGNSAAHLHGSKPAKASSGHGSSWVPDIPAQNQTNPHKRAVEGAINEQVAKMIRIADRRRSGKAKANSRRSEELAMLNQAPAHLGPAINAQIHAHNVIHSAPSPRVLQHASSPASVQQSSSAENSMKASPCVGSSLHHDPIITDQGLSLACPQAVPLEHVSHRNGNLDETFNGETVPGAASIIPGLRMRPAHHIHTESIPGDPHLPPSPPSSMSYPAPLLQTPPPLPSRTTSSTGTTAASAPSSPSPEISSSNRCDHRSRPPGVEFMHP